VPPPAARSRVSGRALAGSCLASLPLASCRRCCRLRSRLLGRPRAPTLLVSRLPMLMCCRHLVTVLHASSLHRAVTAAPQRCVASVCASTSLLVLTSRTWACRGRSRVISPLTVPLPPCYAATAARVHVSSPAALACSACTCVVVASYQGSSKQPDPSPSFPSLLCCPGQPGRIINPAWMGHVHSIRAPRMGRAGGSCVRVLRVRGPHRS
jgi:hypothetical protein